MKSKHCVIVSACPVTPAMRHYLHPDSLVIACDAGYRNLPALGVDADLIVGDFDSAPHPDTDGNVVVLPHIKDDTDTHFAARKAVELGAEEVVLLGALGGARFDHALANLGTALFLAKQGIAVTLADETTELHLLCPGKTLCLPRQSWHYLSLFPLEGRLVGVAEQGTFYPLNDASLTADYPIGVSNEFTADTACISCKSGYGLVVLQKE